jgi:hypothetical protein
MGTLVAFGILGAIDVAWTVYPWVGGFLAMIFALGIALFLHSDAVAQHRDPRRRAEIDVGLLWFPLRYLSSSACRMR